MATPVTIAPAGGMSNPIARLGGDLNTFRSLVNCRLSPNGGAIEQTGEWIDSSSLYTAGTYYSGGSQTQPATAGSSLYLAFVTSTGSPTFEAGRYAARVNSTQIQVVKQTSFPVAETALTSCLLVINSYSGLNLTLGLTLDVEMTGAAAFRWRKNGGGWTAGVPSTSGVSIDGGNATLYFLAATGFAGTETWAWTRLDWFEEANGPELTYNWSYDLYNQKVYFVDYSGRVMLFENNGVRSVGYRPVYGTNVVVFQNHLYVANYSTAIFLTTGFTMVSANSDLNNFDNFFSTDTNEADSFRIVGTQLDSNSAPNLRITGYYKRESILYIITTTSVWTNQYLGLPNVNDYQFAFIFPGHPGGVTSSAQNAPNPIITAEGAYLFATDGVYFFNGSNLILITDGILGEKDRFVGTGFNLKTIPTIFAYWRWGGYDNTQNEVYFWSQTTYTPAGLNGFYVYQERTKSWYFRTMSPPGAVGTTRTLSVDRYGRMILPLGLGYVIENTGFESGYTALLDASTIIQVPFIETQDLDFGEIQTVKEINELYLDAFYGDDASQYGTTGVTIDVAVRNYGQDTVSYTSAIATWAKTATDGQLSYLGSSRIFRFKIRPTVSSTKAARTFIFNRLVLNVNNLKKDQVRR